MTSSLPDPGIGPLWLVRYEISSGIGHGAEAVVHTAVVETSAPEEAAARDQALRWVRDNDPYFDDRIDPSVRVLAVEQIDTADAR